MFADEIQMPVADCGIGIRAATGCRHEHQMREIGQSAQRKVGCQVDGKATQVIVLRAGFGPCGVGFRKVDVAQDKVLKLADRFAAAHAEFGANPVG